MKNILVAGAGHGGLSAAYNLAKAGYNVTVLEANERNNVGHDWHDSMNINTFDFAGLPRPPKESYMPGGYSMAYVNPKKTVKLAPPHKSNDNWIFIDRKMLLSHLISCCENEGVKFVFGAKCESAIISGNRVTGVKAEINGEIQFFYAELIIDAAGVNSPVRLSLPKSIGILNEINEADCIHCWRAYFEKTEDLYTEPNYTVFFFHCQKPGIDWAITEPGHIDILIGKFGTLSDDEIAQSKADFSEQYPYMSNNIVRGGGRALIPIRRTLPKIVANGYALVGDSAAMTEPLSGSGINLSIKAGKMLASTVIRDKKCLFTEKTLWAYQYRYFTTLGIPLLTVDKIRSFISKINADNIDFFVENKILTEREIQMSGGNIGYSLKEIITKLASALPQAYLLPELINTFKGLTKLNKLAENMPPIYEKNAVLSWQEQYINF